MTQTEHTTDSLRITLVGAGVIGAGWAARCLAAGHDVIVSDPSAEAFEKLQASVQQAWPVLRKRGLAAEASTARVRYERSEEHTSELQSRFDLVCRLLLEKKNEV